MKLISNFLLVTSAISLVVPVIFLSIAPGYLRREISRELVIKENSSDFSVWIEPDTPIYLKVFIFNLTNQEEFLNGQKPRLEELGPYVFVEKRRKFDIKFTEHGKIVSYLEKKSYSFDQQLSGNRSLDDNIVFIDVPSLAVVNWYLNLDSETQTWLGKDINQAFNQSNASAFRSLSVSEIIYGFKVRFAPILNHFLKARNFSLIPEEYGLLNQKNNSQNGFEIHTGKDDMNQLLKINKFNDLRTFNSWKPNSVCDLVAGTDGSGFTPNLEYKHTEILASDLCRTLKLVFDKKEVVKGIITRKYSGHDELFAKPEKYPQNSCYCLESEASSCNVSGIVDLSRCSKVPGLFASSPHFHQGDKILVDSVDGLHPNASEHVSYLNVELITGKTFQSAIRVQFNVKTPVTDAFPALQGLRPMYYPFAWSEESLTITDEQATEFRTKVSKKIETAYLIMYIVLVVSIICGGLGLGLKIIKLSRKAAALPLLENEEGS